MVVTVLCINADSRLLLRGTVAGRVACLAAAWTRAPLGAEAPGSAALGWPGLLARLAPHVRE